MTKSQTDTLKVVGQLLALVVLVAGIAFAAGNYPTRGEWEADREKQLDEIEAVKEDVSTMQLEQVRLRGSMSSIEKSQDRSEKTTNEIRQKLDAALLDGKTNNRRR